MNGKRAQALFLFLAVLVSAWASGRADAAAWHWALSLALFAAALYPPTAQALTWGGIAVAAFVLWAVFHTLFLSQSYSPAGIFQPLFLVIAFALGRRAFEQDNGRALARAWVCAIVAITCYALLEAGTTGAFAAAPFETRAVLSALINLALLPALAYALWGPPVSRSRLIALAILVAGLVAAGSRGGWIGFAVGIAATVIVLRGRIPSARNAVACAGAVLSGAGLAVLVRLLGAFNRGHGAEMAGQGWSGVQTFFLLSPAQQLDNSVGRLELYALAIDRLAQEMPFGSGYLSFAQILEAGREHVPSFTDYVTYFVHNDYLQTLLELGVPGLGTLIALMLLPAVFLLRSRPRFAEKDLVLCGGCAGGIAATAFQAGVDFPLYIPACLAGFGFLLGALAARSAAAGIGILRIPPPAGAISQFAVSARRIGLATGIVLLLVPLAAEWSLAYAQARWRQGFTQEAAYGIEIARRLQPRDWRYEWYAGKFWTAQAVSERNPKAAALADAAFERGFAVNRLEAKNLLGRIELQRSLPMLMERPASTGELEAWSAMAMELAPRNPDVRIERILILEQGGKLAAARSEAARLARDEPENGAVRFLAARLAEKHQ